MSQWPMAPEWEIESWLNTKQPLTLESLRGRLVVVYAFQMLCPGCVQRSLPQAQEIRQAFPEEEVAVIGLHTVFEHHEAMTRTSLEAFAHEYRLKFPIGIDQPDGAGVPRTMARYQMQGTPTLLLIDREGRLRLQRFGHLPDLTVGAYLGTLLAE